MSISEDFNDELRSIETRFTGGLSNTSTKKFDDLIPIVSTISGVDEDKIYITAATSRASNLWNRLAQGKPLTQHFSLALGIIEDSDLQGGLAPASKFIGPGVGHYDAIALTVKRNDTWVVAAVLDTSVLPVYDLFVAAFPEVEITHEQPADNPYSLDVSEVAFAWYVGTTGNDTEGNWHDFSEEYISDGVWENGWNDKFQDLVNSIQVGDRIVIKSTFTQKRNLPFRNNGKTVGAMRIKAIGVVTGNSQDGKHLQVDWTKVDPAKVWYGPGTLRETIHRVDAGDGIVKRQLLAFTFADEPQDYSLCEERYADEIDFESGTDELTEEALEGTGTDSQTPASLPVFSARVRTKHPLNMIFYGAPGTGKTYSTAQYALAVVENRDYSEIAREPRDTVMKRYSSLIKDGKIVFTTFHQNYGYEDFIQGIRPTPNVAGLSFKMMDGVFKRIVDNALSHPENDYVIIIDEINRANISKVFGELITLIEDDKRWGEVNAISVTLPSGDIFAVPNNLYILGTMNSADKSISLIDTALRRRFQFIEFAPDYSLIGDADLRKILEKLNAGISSELGSTDLLIGHSYFMHKTHSDLCSVMNNSIIPLLYEYFFDNQKKVEAQVKAAIDGCDVKVLVGTVGRIRLEEKDVE